MVVGKPLSRIEGREKVTGAAVYAVEALVPGAAYGVIVQSTIAKGTVTDLDTSAVMAAPGVIAVLTPDNMPKVTEGFSGDSRAPLSDSSLVFAGQHLAVVVADTLEHAQYAASLVRVVAAEESPTVSMTDERVSDTLTVSDGEEVPEARRGDVASALNQPGLTIVSATYHTPVETHNPMEPSATVAAWDGDDKLTVWDSTQGVSRTRDALAKAFGLDPDNVRVFCPHVGGGFGCKGEQWHHKFLAAAAARLAGRPVRLALTRQQMFTSCGHRPETEQAMTLAAGDDGKLVAVRHASIVQSSSTNTHIERCGMGTSRVLYATPNLGVTHVLREVDLAPPTWMRAPGEAPGSFALESAMDELAIALKMDPVELRLINHADSFPEDGRPWSTKHLKECYRIGAERFRWSRREPNMRAPDGRAIGWGMATASYPAWRWSGTARIRLSLGEDGRLVAVSSAASQDLGTGTWTIGVQMTADLLGLTADQVTFEIGDSGLPRSGLSGGSATAAGLAHSLGAACNELKRLLLSHAEDTPVHGLRPNETVFTGGRLVAADDASRSVQVAELLARIPSRIAEGMNNPDAPLETGDVDYGGLRDKYAFSSFGAHFVEVLIGDPVPTVTVSRVVSVVDIGRVVNLKTARSQVAGGVVMGIGMALMEETRYDRRTGRPVNDNLADYAMCVNSDVPQIDVAFIDEPDYLFNPIGCRGVGEIGITGVAAAIANAVFHATGRRIRDLPITLDKLL